MPAALRTRLGALADAIAYGDPSGTGIAYGALAASTGLAALAWYLDGPILLRFAPLFFLALLGVVTGLAHAADALGRARTRRWWHTLQARATLELPNFDPHFHDGVLRLLQEAARTLGPDHEADDVIGWAHAYRTLATDGTLPTRMSIADAIGTWPTRHGHPGWLLALADIHPTEPLPNDATRQSLSLLAILRGHALPHPAA